jgi:dolichol-phosphate mannosyltransferase
MEYEDTTVIIPTLNEEKNICELMERLCGMYKGINVIVSDDGSKDKTQKIVKLYNKKFKKINLLDRSKEKVHGLTASVLDAVKLVKSEYIVVMDGDMQHPPEKVKEIVKKLRENNDIVIGTRKKVHFRSYFRLCMSKGAILLGQLRLLWNKIWVHDIVSGFFGVKTQLFQWEIKKHENGFEKEGYKVLFDMLRYVRGKVKIREISYTFGERVDGKSKINTKHIIIYLRSIFK